MYSLTFKSQEERAFYIAFKICSHSGTLFDINKVNPAQLAYDFVKRHPLEMPRRNENGTYPIPLLTHGEYRKEMLIQKRVAAIVSNMNCTDSQGNLVTLVPVQEAERFVRRHGVGSLWPDRDSNNCFIYPLRLNLEQLILNAEDQDALNEDCNDRSEPDRNKSITVFCQSSYKKNDSYSIDLEMWNRDENLVLCMKLLLQTLMKQGNQIGNEFFINRNNYELRSSSILIIFSASSSYFPLSISFRVFLMYDGVQICFSSLGVSPASYSCKWRRS